MPQRNIIFTGGGTLGPVTPLIAVMRRLREHDPDLKFTWIGTPNGPERAVVEREGIPFVTLETPKLPRYFHLDWFRFPFVYLKTRKKAEALMDEIAPQLVASVGGYVGVPVIFAAAKRGIPCAIHQLDAEPGLANKIVAGRCASVTGSFMYERPPFRRYDGRAATPCRFANVELPSLEAAASEFGLDPARPVVFVTGGGTGALALNRLLADVLKLLPQDIQVLHLTGAGKGTARLDERHHPFEFFSESQMLAAFTLARVVVARAGIGTISELAQLSKAAILMPMPKTHQEANVKRLGDAVLSADQTSLSAAQLLAHQLIELVNDPMMADMLGRRLHKMFPTDDGSELAEKWMRLISK